VKFSRNTWILKAVAVLTMAMAVGTGCRKSAIDPFPASAKDLYQYIDGDAEQYISAGVISTSTADYKYEGQLEAVVDVHYMSDAVGARKIMETGKTTDAKQVQLGDAGLEYGQSVVFRRGPYLVRIVAYESKPETQDALLLLARGVEAKL